MRNPQSHGQAPATQLNPDRAVGGEIECPVFRDPSAYLAQREPAGIAGRLKKRRERRAMARCLTALQLTEKDMLLDVPCGPGRLYGYFNERRFQVTGADLSNEMLSTAEQVRARICLPGVDHRADAFALPWADATFDAVVCTRFAYYFDHKARVALLSELGRVSKSGLIVQLKTAWSQLSRLRALRGKPSSRNDRLFLLTKDEIEADVAAAGMTVVLISTHGAFSDRAFVAMR